MSLRVVPRLRQLIVELRWLPRGSVALQVDVVLVLRLAGEHAFHEVLDFVVGCL